MDENNQAEPPQRYVWPWFVLGGVVLGIVLAVLWMSVLVHRIREQRESSQWSNGSQPAQPIPALSISTQAVPVVLVPQTNSSALKVPAGPAQK